MASELTQYQAPLPVAAEQRGTSPEAWHILSTVLYKGASEQMVCTILDYCKARKLDPLKKPFHIVQVWDADQRKMVDSIWPSIGETRITAMRTGQYAGMAEMKHGPTKTETIGNTKLSFPEWAQCTVYRMVGGERCEFAGPKVYWLETYAQAGRNPDPNYMWKKRPFGQLDKCAEAAALRCAFPEENFMATAEEMEGQEVHIGPDMARELNPRPVRDAADIDDLDALVDYMEQEGRPPAGETDGQDVPPHDADGVILDDEGDPFADLGGLSGDPLPLSPFASTKEAVQAMADAECMADLDEADKRLQLTMERFSPETRAKLQTAMEKRMSQIMGAA